MGQFLLTFFYEWQWFGLHRPLRRGGNPPASGRKPAPPAGPPIYGWGPHQLNPPPPAPGMRREYLLSPATMAECGGPCFEAWDPRACTCGARWRDVLMAPEMDPRFGVPWDEGSTQRGNGQGGPATPKPPIKPKPTGGRSLKPWE